MKTLWTALLFQPFLNGLIFLNNLFDSLGLAIILLTVLIRSALFPLTLPAMRAAKKMAELAPELERLRKKHGDNKQKLAQAQMDLYKKHGANPAAGCLPQIIQLIILIALYQAFAQVLKVDGAEVITRLNELLYPFLRLSSQAKINLSFLYLQLDKPDLIRFAGLPLPGFFLLSAALVQFLTSKMMSRQVAVQEKEAAKTKEKTDDIAAAAQSQMLYLFPLMTIFIGFTFPSGLVLYWFTFSAVTAIQQYLIAGPGGLEPWLQKLKSLKS